MAGSFCAGKNKVTFVTQCSSIGKSMSVNKTCLKRSFRNASLMNDFVFITWQKKNIKIFLHEWRQVKKKLINEKTFCYGSISDACLNSTSWNWETLTHNLPLLISSKLQVYFYFVETISIKKRFPSFSLSFVTITTKMSS